MNIVTNEPTGLFLIPLGATLGNQVWGLVNGLGLIFIPFAALYIYAFFTSRAQGRDEGSPAVLAIKLVEFGFYPMLLILFFCLIPVSGSLNTTYKQYSCMDEPSVSSNAKIDISQASAAALQALGVDTKTSPPMLFGIVHQVSTGINEALTSTLSCNKGSSAVEAGRALKSISAESQSVALSIREFNKQCYLPTRNDVIKAMSEGKLLRNSNTNNKYAWSFYPPNSAVATGVKLMLDAYDGYIIEGAPGSKKQMEPSSTWISDTYKGVTTDCDVLAQELYNKISTDIDNSSSSTVKNATSALTGFVSLFNNNTGTTALMVKHDLIMAVYENAGRVQKEDRNFQAASRKQFSNSVPTVTTQPTDSERDSENFSLSADNGMSTMLVALGSFFTDITEDAKSLGATMVIPLMVVVFQVLLCAFLPMVGLLSGFKPKVIYSWILAYFSVTLIPFWLNFAVQLQTILLSLGSYNEYKSSIDTGVADTTFTSTHLLGTTANMFVYVIPMVWIVLVQIVGNIGASVVTNALSGSTQAGQAGAKQLEELQKGVSKGADRYGGKLADKYEKAKRGLNG